MLALMVAGCVGASAFASSLEEQFAKPPAEYRPMPFWHINGELTSAGIRRQMRDGRDLAGLSGVSVLPFTTGGRRPGTQPGFLSEAYFDRFR